MLKDEVKKYAGTYKAKLQDPPNILAANLMDMDDRPLTRHLKRKIPQDLTED